MMNKVINDLITILEKEHGIELYTQDKPITREALEQLFSILHNYKREVINEHIITKFGVN